MRTLMAAELQYISGGEQNQTNNQSDPNGILRKLGQVGGLAYGSVLGLSLSSGALVVLAMAGLSFGPLPNTAIVGGSTAIGAYAGTKIGGGIGYGLGALTDMIAGK